MLLFAGLAMVLNVGSGLCLSWTPYIKEGHDIVSESEI